jgi:hypothetical protein
MPVREFIDSTGTEWRAWEVTPDAIYPPTRGEDYLADSYQLGWVVMETKRGDRRLRICPIPHDWQVLSDEALEELLQHGEALPARTAAARGGIADMAAVRTFRYPGGRVWTVSLTPHPTEPNQRVLRFSAGARVIDVVDWPGDWAEQSDEALIDLLRREAPRGILTGSDARRRRAGDSPP